MRARLLAISVLLAAGFAAAGSGAAASLASTRRPFTVRDARFRVLNHRLTYTATICTQVKSVLAVRATFAPVGAARGLVTLTPGATQYQDHGCWPVFVSSPIARRATQHCNPLSCPAHIGSRYRATVTVTYPNPRYSVRAPRRVAKA